MSKRIEVDENVIRAAIDDEMRAFVYGSDLEVLWEQAGAYRVEDVLQRLRAHHSATDEIEARAGEANPPLPEDPPQTPAR